MTHLNSRGNLLSGQIMSNMREGGEMGKGTLHQYTFYFYYLLFFKDLIACFFFQMFISYNILRFSHL